MEKFKLIEYLNSLKQIGGHPPPLEVFYYFYTAAFTKITTPLLSRITAIKSVKQSYKPTPEILLMMKTFRHMVNDAIRIGLQNDVSLMKKLCQLSYKETARYDIVNYYRLCAISKAAGILANRRKSLKRGYQTKNPRMRQPILISCYGFKLEDGILKVPLGSRRYFSIPLDDHTKAILESGPDVRIRSFTLTPESISICFSKQIEELKPVTAIGIDRNLANLTVGNLDSVIQYNVTKAVQIADNNRSVMRALKRNDVRIRKQLSMKHGRRRILVFEQDYP